MAGGTREQALHAAAIALKNIMGLVCDPIAGLVESPCSKRNASGVLNALSSADLALAGVESIIPFDEVVEAMYAVGLAMHPDFKETARGGIATTPTGQALLKQSADEAVVTHIDALGGGHFRQTRHRHDVAGERDDEPRAAETRS